MSLKDLIARNKNKSIPIQKRTENVNPFSLLNEDTNNLFSNFLKNFGEFGSLPFSKEWTKSFTPKVNVSEDETSVEVSAELPGLSQKDIELSLEDNILTIKGEKKEEKEEQEKNYYHFERSFGGFQRSIELPIDIQEDQVKASFKNGILEVHIPKSEKAGDRIRKIAID